MLSIIILLYKTRLNFFSSSYFVIVTIVGRPCGQLYGFSSCKSSSISASASAVDSRLPPFPAALQDMEAIFSQMITPPVIITLNLQEEELQKRHMTAFTDVGFEISPFGGREYAISAVPGNLYSLASRDLFLEILDGLSGVSERASDQIVCEKIASMSCKAAVKGGSRLSTAEADALIDELLQLENPYNCPHGRPTIVTMTKYELEKKFKRVL